MTTREPSTKANTPSLRDQLVKRIDEWLDRTVPRLNKPDDGCGEAVLTITLYTGDNNAYCSSLDDDTPFIDCTVVEQLRVENVGGWHE